MSEKLTAHAYSISAANNSLPIGDLLKLIADTAFGDRLRVVNTGQYRVEECFFMGEGLWFVDFGKLRQGHGPGAASTTTKTRGLVFNNGEKFCEETACIIDTNKNFMVTQFNFNGARAGTMAEYFNVFDQASANAYSLIPKYDDEVLKKFDKRKVTKSFEYTIDPREFSAEDKRRGLSLTQALDMADQNDGVSIQIRMAAPRSKKSGLNASADKVINFLRKKSVDNPHAVTNLKVGYMSDFDSKVEIIDLLAQRLKISFKDLALGGDNRISWQERLRVLISAHNQWKRLF